ncbi:BON domain-containing protein [Leptothoe spongobia]|uniref:BON domain-containing protein n=1 Tax=Leptothoe spongobia TAU-MAC 1115 TaxID=1967444 RepID=A0A947GIL1_9CYAN|nr:BON domain-containing protein [Leptothoe spongobia]MBT9314952.1 BON domain-containing protein [Leptothoe spongobia TAU-MAC 1115]
MDGSTISIPLKGVYSPHQLASDGLSRCRWFSSIPPERMGLYGEYDYHGLSKRVFQCLNKNVDGELRRLKIRQRGRVVVLSGQLGSPYQLREIVTLALSVDGVDEVETYGVRLLEAC